MTRQEFELIARLLKSKEPVITAVGLALFEFSKPIRTGPLSHDEAAPKGLGGQSPRMQGCGGLSVAGEVSATHSVRFAP